MDLYSNCDKSGIIFPGQENDDLPVINCLGGAVQNSEISDKIHVKQIDFGFYSALAFISFQ